MEKLKTADPIARVVILCPHEDKDEAPTTSQEQAFCLVRPLFEANALKCSDAEDMDGYYAVTVKPVDCKWTDQDEAVLSAATSALADFGYEVCVGRKLCDMEAHCNSNEPACHCDEFIDDDEHAERVVGIAAIGVLVAAGALVAHAAMKCHRFKR